MTYSVVGSGAIGSALAGHFANKGIEVSLANTGYVVPQKPIRLALEEHARPGTKEVATCLLRTRSADRQISQWTRPSS
jgi:predicted dinucleotide-binding enzyme